MGQFVRKTSDDRWIEISGDEYHSLPRDFREKLWGWLED